MKIKILSKFYPELIMSGKRISFINFASIGSVLSKKGSDVEYFCDGMLMAYTLKLLTRVNVQRVSFDFTSIASDVFKYSLNNSLRVYILGAEQSEVETFVSKINYLYKGINVVGFRSGFFSDNEFDLIKNNILDLKPDVLIVGLGAGKQEDFINSLHDNGFKGTSFTCGGFIRQEASSKEFYYPPLINKLKLRAFYRMHKEPHTIKRYFIDYPKNMVNILFLHLKGSIGFDIQ